MEKTDVADVELFYRTKAEAKELSLSTDDLERRLDLTNKIIANLAIIHTESVGLNPLSERIASLACALRLLREPEQERAWPKEM